MSGPNLGPSAPDEQVDQLDRDLRCLIVDDESPARDELRFLLDEHGGVQVVGSAATGEEALVLLQNVAYDIVFLDIRMPGLNGLELAARIHDSPNRPQVVFTTAHPDHAVDAFDLSAADYLLKPLSSERLAESIARAKARIATSEPSPASAADGVGAGPAQARPPSAAGYQENRLPVQRGDRTVFVNERDIVAAAAAHGYSYIYLRNERVLVNYSLAELEQRLSAAFFRVHRSYLANLNRLIEIRPDFKGGLVVVMDDEARTRIPVSRRQAQELRRRLGM